MLFRYSKLSLMSVALVGILSALLTIAGHAQETAKQGTDADAVKSTATDDANSDDAKSKEKQADDPDEPVEGLRFSNPVATKWKINAIIKGGSGPANTMLITMPIPTAWPEQAVSVVDEDIPANIAKVTYRDLDSGVRQLIASIPQIRPREEIMISVTFLVSTSQIDLPGDTSVFVRPKSNHREGKPYLGVSPQINFRNSKLRKQVKSIIADKTNVWDEIQGLFDWVRDNIEDTESEPQDVLKVLRDKSGCAEDKVGLFVAMCRANKIPARIVWVFENQYAEFMLVDSEGNPHWFPCSVAGIREFGSVAEPRIVLQKGDSVRVPEKKSPQKFVGEFATCKGTSKPSVRFVRQKLPAD